MKTTQNYLFSVLALISSLPAGAHSDSSVAVASHFSVHMLEAGVIMVGLLALTFGLRCLFKR